MSPSPEVVALGQFLKKLSSCCSILTANCADLGRHDSWYGDTQHNDTLLRNTRDCDTQHYDSKVTLRIMTLSIATLY